jgi:hypothetical protein
MRILMDIEPLRHKDFRRLWLAGAITTSGAQLTAVAVPMQIYGLTRSSADVGLAGLVGFVPMVLGSLCGGALVDAADRRLVLLCTNSGIGAASLLLWIQAAAHLRSVALLLVLVGLQQACFGANAAAGGAVVPRLVPRVGRTTREWCAPKLCPVHGRLLHQAGQDRDQAAEEGGGEGGAAGDGGETEEAALRAVGAEDAGAVEGGSAAQRGDRAEEAQ